MIKWHRLFGLTLSDYFTDSPFEVELDKDLSTKQQFLDVVILRRGKGEITVPLPDGLEDLADHNLISYKSRRQALDAWAIDELMGHFANYRKHVSHPRQKLLPLEQFRLFGISTRFPTKLRNEVKLEKRQTGVYEVLWGIHPVRIIVLSEMPDSVRNTIWELFSGVPAKVEAGARRYRPRRADISTVIKQLFESYRLEGLELPYTWEDFQREYTLDHINHLTAEERLRGLPAEERLRGLSPEEVLSRFSMDELNAYLRERQQAEEQSRKR